MTEQQERKIFKELKDYIDSALHVARIRSQISQKELAKRLGKNRKFIDDVEQQRISITFNELQLFCKALDEKLHLS